MEQKKILWITVAIAAFFVIVFGFLAVLYSPSRSTGPALRQAYAAEQKSVQDSALQAASSQTGIDPDTWVRQPGATPGLDNSLVSTPGNMNLTIVNGDNAGTRFGTLDVSGLTKDNQQQAQTGSLNQPEIVGSAGTGLALADGTPITQQPATVQNGQQVQSGISQQTAGAASATQISASSADASSTEVNQPVKSKQTTVKEQPKQTSVKASSPAPAAKKSELKAVTEYWIQTGSFTGKLNAEKARDALNARYLSAEIFTKEVGGSTTYRVRVGPYASKTEADYWLGTIKEIADFSGSYISEVKTKK